MTPSTGQILLSELFGTFILIVLGAGVCAAVTLPKSKAQSSGWIVISWGWGLAVFMGVYAGYATGAHTPPPSATRSSASITSHAVRLSSIYRGL